MTDITNVVSAVITLLVAVITTFLIPYPLSERESRR